MRRCVCLGLLLLALAGCRTRLTEVELTSRAEGRALRYGTYLPPRWDGVTPLPLVVFLHGAGDDASSFDRHAVTQRLDAAIVSGQVPPFILVTPEGDRGFWVNWHDGSHRFRDWVLDEVVPDVRARHPTQPEPAGLHLVGISMGGGGGLQMWLREPERFASVTILGTPIMNADDTRTFLGRLIASDVIERIFGPPEDTSGIDPYVALSGPASLHGSRLLFGAADRDHPGIPGANASFHRHLAAAGVPHRYIVYPGFHSWAAWARVFPYALCVQLDPACTMPPPRGSTVAVEPATASRARR